MNASIFQVISCLLDLLLLSLLLLLLILWFIVGFLNVFCFCGKFMLSLCNFIEIVIVIINFMVYSWLLECVLFLWKIYAFSLQLQ
jgi:hypothetical protein